MRSCTLGAIFLTLVVLVRVSVARAEPIAEPEGPPPPVSRSPEGERSWLRTPVRVVGSAAGGFVLSGFGSTAGFFTGLTGGLTICGAYLLNDEKCPRGVVAAAKVFFYGAYFGATAAGAAAGVVGGSMLLDHGRRGNLLVVALGASAGTAAGYGVARAIEPKRENGAPLIVVSGATLGALIANELTLSPRPGVVAVPSLALGPGRGGAPTVSVGLAGTF